MSRVSRRTRSTFDGLLQEIAAATRLAEQPGKCAARADSVSHWSVQQQLDHLLKTDRALLAGLRRSLAGEIPFEGGGPTLMGRLVLLTGFIPRGKGKAPESVLPDDRTPGEIAAGFEETQRAFDTLRDALPAIESNRARIPHPVLGCFNGVQWLRFAYLHHRHHNKIIDDILRSPECTEGA